MIRTLAWETLAIVIVGCFLLVYLLGPVLIRFTLRQWAGPKARTLDLDDPDLPGRGCGALMGWRPYHCTGDFCETEKGTFMLEAEKGSFIRQG